MKRDIDEWSDNRTVNLNPANWQSGRPKPHEPFFGEGLFPTLAYVIGFAIMVSAVHYFR